MRKKRETTWCFEKTINSSHYGVRRATSQRKNESELRNRFTAFRPSYVAIALSRTLSRNYGGFSLSSIFLFLRFFFKFLILGFFASSQKKIKNFFLFYFFLFLLRGGDREPLAKSYLSFSLKTIHEASSKRGKHHFIWILDGIFIRNFFGKIFFC